ncbi:MAG: SH3 domain-containing protein [Nitrospirae bacterium]|uniref:SH3 domain-containing protein n=1 Tax=Candidatus Magnetobacterium casense TaxID=1455061 RepID=UPI00058CC949|nr:SH3 domain-containing protein [Candidatus Magnetobacterium casensis]MBF0337619.1 SH3 domain-containing protein [Nitrospirota bacterium]
MTTKRFVVLIFMLVFISCSTKGRPPGGVPSGAVSSHKQQLATPGECVNNGGFWIRAKGAGEGSPCRSEPGSISVGVLNTASGLRKLPQNNAGVVAVLQKGEEVFVLESAKDNWTKVKTVCAVEGWVLNKYLAVTRVKPPHAIQGVDIKAGNSVRRGQKLNIEVDFVTTEPKEGAQLFFCLHPLNEEPSEHMKGNAEFTDKGQWTYAKSFNINQNAPLGDWVAHIAIYYKTGWLDAAEVRFKVMQ